MMRAMVYALSLTLAAPAAAADLQAPLQPLSFLVGNWTAGEGRVAETGGTSRGISRISIESDGWALLREDRTDLFDKTGKPAGRFHQTMMIYPEAGTVHADYVDGEGHAIHYVSAEIAGNAATFTSALGAGPVFRLSYTLEAPRRLAVSFAMAPPGQTTFRAIATGVLRKLD